jgi:hypothetical protein
MMAGVVSGGRPIVAGSGALWTPLNMAVVPQIYLDAQDSAVTNVSGACSEISNLGAMGSNGNFSQSTAGNRPSIVASALNGKTILSFDGADDRMQGASTAQKGLLRNVTSAWVYAVVKKRTTDASDTTRVLAGVSDGTSVAPRFITDVGFGGTGGANKPFLAAKRLDAGATAELLSTSAISGSYYMVLHEVNYSTRAGRIYTNGSLAIENTALIDTAGSTSNTDSQHPLVIGSFPSQAAGFADVDLAAIVISNAAPSGGDIDKLFGWAAHKYGLTASLPTGHPYKTTAPTA